MNNKSLAPICLFVYNRLEHTKKTIEYLKKNELANESILFIFSDYPKTPKESIEVSKVREYIRNISGFKRIVITERKRNYGLAKSVLKGVTKVINKFNKIIVLEDDLIVSEYFLDYMNEALVLYKNEKKVGSISGFLFPLKNESSSETFFLNDINSWGWGTWKDRWDLFESNGNKLFFKLKERNMLKSFDNNYSYPYKKMLVNQIKGKNNSWAIRWRASMFLNNKISLYPFKSLTKNIGFDETGVNCNKNNLFDTKITNNKIKVEKLEIKLNNKMQKEVESFFHGIRLKRIIGKIKRLVREK